MASGKKKSGDRIINTPKTNGDLPFKGEGEYFIQFILESPVAVHMYELKDSDLIFLGGNKSADRILGLNHNELVGKTIYQAFPAFRESTDIPEKYKEVILTGKPWETEQVFYEDERISGAFQVYAFSTGIGRMAAMFTDITERKKSEEKLAQSEEKYRRIFETIEQGIIYLDKRHVVIDANPAAYKILGVSREDRFINNVVFNNQEVFREDGNPQNFGELIDGVIQKGSNITGPVILNVHTKNAEDPIWIAVDFFRQDDAGIKGTDHIMIVFTDITFRKIQELEMERKNADLKSKTEEYAALNEEYLAQNEKILKINEELEKRTHQILEINRKISESEQRFRNVIENSSDILYCINYRTGVYEYFSPSVKEILGYESSDFTNRPPEKFLKYLHPDDYAEYKDFWKNVVDLESQNIFLFKTGYRLRDLSGKYHWMSENHKLLWDEENKPLFLIGSIRDITDIREIDNALRLSEERLSFALEATDDALWDLDLIKNESYQSPRWYAMLGLKADKKLNREETQKIIHPQDLDYYKDCWNKFIAGNEDSLALEFRIKRHTGEWIWIQLRGKCVARDDKGNVARAVGTHTDITLRKQYELALKSKNEELAAAEEELRATNDELINLNELLRNQNQHVQETYEKLKESEEKFRNVVTSSHAITFILDRNGVYQLSEGLPLKSLQLKPGQLVDMSAYDIYKDYPEIRNNISQALKGINIRATEEYKDLYFDTIYSPFKDDSGKTKGVIGIALEVTDQMKLQKAMLESEEKFNQLAENIKDMFWLREGNQYIYLNTAFEKTWGVSRETLLQDPDSLMKRVHPEDIEIFKQINDVALSGGTDIETAQFRIIAPGGETRWVWTRVFPIFNKKKEIYRVAGITSDITEQKNTENELRVAKDKAQESDRLKSAFLANISHEIRTPLNGIIGFSGLLGKEELDLQSKQRYIEIINKSSDQLLHIIDDLVDISKIEAGQMQLVLNNCSLNELLDDLHTLFLHEIMQLNKVNLRLEHHNSLQEKESEIITDEFRLRQVLTNLIFNAIKFTDEGFIKFGYEIDNKFLKFYVQDTGIGISNSVRETVFEPFRQGEDINKSIFGGTGLGLSISRGLVKLLGGEIWFESAKDAGSTFYFTIPYKPVKAVSDPEKTADSQSQEPNWSDLTILIVEDDDMNFEYLKEVLRPSGVKIRRSVDGIEAVHDIQNHAPKIVLMDIRLPVMNGLEATQKIRESGNPVPIIAQTAYAMVEDYKLCMEAGCNDYISKPAKKDILLQKIAYWLKKASQ